MPNYLDDDLEDELDGLLDDDLEDELSADDPDLSDDELSDDELSDDELAAIDGGGLAENLEDGDELSSDYVVSTPGVRELSAQRHNALIQPKFAELGSAVHLSDCKPQQARSGGVRKPSSRGSAKKMRRNPDAPQIQPHPSDPTVGILAAGLIAGIAIEFEDGTRTAVDSGKPVKSIVVVYANGRKLVLASK